MKYPSTYPLLVLLLLVCFSLSATVHAGFDVDTDFGQASNKVEYAAGIAKGKITGVVPEGWSDNSNWADVDVAYQPAESEGRKFLRLNITRVQSGNAQLTYTLPDIMENEVICEFQIVMRNQSQAPVSAGLRLRGTPYTYLWDSPPLASGEWETHTFRFRVKKNDQPIGLYLRAPGVGHVDIAQVSLKAIDPEAYKQQLMKQYPEGGPANLLRDTRFVYPLPAGWSLDRDTSDIDEANVTTDQAGAMTIETTKEMMLFSAPFRVLNPLIEHHAVARVSGTGDWHLEVMNQRQVVGSVPLELDKQGQQRDVVVKFKPDLFKADCQLRFRATKPGKLTIHWVKVGAAEQVGKYDPTKQPVVGIQLQNTAAAVAGVQFTDEQGSLQIKTIDAPASARLIVHIKHGMQQHSKYAQLRPGEWSLDYLNDDKRLLGAYHVAAWLEDRNKTKLTPVSERVVYLLHRPRYWGKDGEASAFGVHTNSTIRHNRMAKAVGINWVRLHDAGLNYIGWNFLEPKKGQWQFFDEPLDRYRAEKLMIFGQLGTAPAWASYYPAEKRDNKFGYFDRFFQPRDLDDYRNYVRTVTSRYRNTIRYWDVWNEPWIHAWWAVDYDSKLGGRAGYITSKQPQQDFVNLMKAARDMARAVNPHVKIAGFNTTAGQHESTTRFTGPDWTKGIYDAGGLANSDILVYHHYAGGSLGHPDDDVAKGLEAAFGYVKEQEGKLTKPVWMTEGQPNIGRTNEGLYKHSLTEPAGDSFVDAGDRMVRYLTSLRAHGVSKIFLYSMHAHTGQYGDGSNQWRVLTQTDGSLHPVGAAISALAFHIDGLEYRKHVELANGVHAYVFSDGVRTAAVVSPMSGHADWPVPNGTEDLWGNPIKAGETVGRQCVFVVGSDAEKLLND